MGGGLGPPEVWWQPPGLLLLRPQGRAALQVVEILSLGGFKAENSRWVAGSSTAESLLSGFRFFGQVWKLRVVSKECLHSIIIWKEAAHHHWSKHYEHKKHNGSGASAIRVSTYSTHVDLH